MTRVIAGTARGLRLSVPDSGTRPTSDRIRESIFARLESWNAIDDAAVLDLFGGSGALGIESLSRGAAKAAFIDSSAAAIKTLKQNLEGTGFSDSAEVRKQKALAYLESLGDSGRFDLVFVDPPYAMSEPDLGAHLSLLRGNVTEDSTIVIERNSRSPEPLIPESWEILSHRKWGDTAAWFASPVPAES